MDVKTVMFAALGLVISGTATMVWVGNDMERIRAEERAELRTQCRAAEASLRTGTDPSVTSSIDEDLVQRCAKLDIDLSALLAAQPGVEAAAGAGSATPAPTAATPPTNPGIAPDPAAVNAFADSGTNSAAATTHAATGAGAAATFSEPAPPPSSLTPAPSTAPQYVPEKRDTSTAAAPSNAPTSSVKLS